MAILLFFAPVSITWVKIVLFCIVMIVGILVGGYIMVRLMAYSLNSSRDAWETWGSGQGLKVDPSSMRMAKNLVGTHKGHSVTVSRYDIGDGDLVLERYVAVEVKYNAALPFSFKIKLNEILWDKLKDLGSAEVVGGEFDKAFSIEASNTTSLTNLLHTPMPIHNSSNLEGDLMLARNKHRRVIVTDRSVCLGIPFDIDSNPSPGPAMDRAVHLVERIKVAADQMRQNKA